MKNFSKRHPLAGGRGLSHRFVRHLLNRGSLNEGDMAVVACSGGLDSTVLLHLLRFAPGLPTLDLTVAHFDHGMRPESAGDLEWLRGLAKAWAVELVCGKASVRPDSEAEARERRYAFLGEVRRERGARWLLTAHQADDQAETVLFRVLRGTGPAGLAGIPEFGHTCSFRPLLPFTREEIRRYAERVRIDFRHDASNSDVRFARNVLRNQILPAAEAGVAPGARKALRRLARVSERDQAGWRSLLGPLLEGIDFRVGSGRVSFDRSAFLEHHTGVRARLLREALRRAGVGLDEAGTSMLLEFTSSSASGARRSLPSGFVLARQFDRFVLHSLLETGPDAELSIPDEGEGSGSIVLGGRVFSARWASGRTLPGRWVDVFASAPLRFPLRLRAWVHGDRIRMSYGTKKLKKVFAEARVPADERRSRPVLVDGSGTVLWVPGVARSSDVPRAHPDHGVVIAVGEAETD